MKSTFKTFIFYEWRLAMRNRWFISFALLFAILSSLMMYLAVYSYSGTGHIGFNRMTAGFMNIALYLIPITSLLLGAVAVAGDRTDGLFSLLRAFPVSSSAYAWGKFCGLGGALTLAIFVGFGISGSIFLLLSGGAQLKLIALFFLFSLLLSFTYLAIGFWLGSWADSRLTAIYGSLAVWFFSVLVYGMLIMAFLPLVPPRSAPGVAIGLLALNPADGLRVITVMAMGEGGVYGPLFHSWSSWLSQPLFLMAVLICFTIIWIGLPLLFTTRWLEKRDVRA